ncbi:MAG: hypothetical protein KGV46_02595 [Pasteurella sp.]|nr:hypothetical protein [Pasteurella sp.]
MNEYNLSDHKAMVQDVFLEVAEISAATKQMKSSLISIQGDIEVLSRSIQEFQKTMKDIQRDIPIAVSESAMVSFDEQLNKMQALQELLDKLNQGDVILSNKKRNSWFRR